MTAARDQIVQATCELFERQGYYATGLNEIIHESGAPKGSLYYYFPAGKEELGEQAIAQTAQNLVERIRANLAQVTDPAEAMESFVRRIADSVEATQFSTGGPLTAVAMETATRSERLNLACRAAFGEIQAVFAEKLTTSGYEPGLAGELATFITASIEGGVLLSRTAHSGDPLRQVAGLLAHTIRTFSPPDNG